jgi:hypothetical protein
MPELWQVWQVNDDTAVWPAADSAGVVLIWKPVPVIASAVAWQALHSAEETGMWLPAPGVPTVPGCCFGCPPMPWLVPENGPLPGPWHALQASEATDEWTIFDVDGFLGCPAAWHTVQAGCADGSGTWLLGRLLPLNGGVVLWQFVQSLGEASGATAWAASAGLKPTGAAPGRTKMLLATPWKFRSVELFSWQLLQVVETYEWLAALITGEVVILKPPVTKFDAWQPLQTDPAFVVMWFAADVTVVAPNHLVCVVAWQLSQV